jgi:ABC-type Fe3+-hydroxamate transport system substrate-binding protein
MSSVTDVTRTMTIPVSAEQLDAWNAVVPVVWTGSGKNKLRLVAG